MILHDIREMVATISHCRILRDMAARPKVIVVFACSGCGVAYRAVQKVLARSRPGRFDCVDCNGIVHLWGGLFDYSEWSRVGDAETDL